MNGSGKHLFTALMVLALGGCATYSASNIENAPGSPTVYEDPSSTGSVAGVGIESQDIQAMTDKMMRDMLTNPILAGAKTPPKIIIDAEFFRNESSSRINKNIITDRLRVNLNRAAQGRMLFIGRHYEDMVKEETAYKDRGDRPKLLSGDYRLGGRITTLDQINPATGRTARYHQIIFEMVDLNNSALVWTGIYDFRKSARDDIIYR